MKTAPNLAYMSRFFLGIFSYAQLFYKNHCKCVNRQKKDCKYMIYIALARLQSL